MEKNPTKEYLQRELNILQLKYDNICETLRTVMRREQDWAIKFRNLKKEIWYIFVANRTSSAPAAKSLGIFLHAIANDAMTWKSHS